MSTTYQQIRDEFLNFFKDKGCVEIKSSSLVPAGDNTLLFTNAGMNQFKDRFAGLPNSGFDDITSACSCQKCVRAGGKHNDLDNVGYTNRHHTFFEMLGNFSFGDYFKEEAIAWAWEFVTKNLQLPKDKLYVTIYHTDDEALQLWKKHIDESRIVKISSDDNFWTMGDTGPCGPCSEIFYDFGENAKIRGGNMEGGVGENDRYMEIWNLVFTQFERFTNGDLKPLKAKNIDTGSGLERLIAVAEGKTDTYETSLMQAIINDIKEYDHRTGDAIKDDVPLRVIADHIRAMTFLINDGVLPSNLGRGYVMRRIIRRAIRYAYQLNKKNIDWLPNLTSSVGKTLGQSYPEILTNEKQIQDVIRKELNIFKKTLNKGIDILNEIITEKNNFLGLEQRENGSWYFDMPKYTTYTGMFRDPEFRKQHNIKEQEGYPHYDNPWQMPEKTLKLKLTGDNIKFILKHDLEPKTRHEYLNHWPAVKIENPGKIAFKLYDTYGFPFDLTQQILREHNIEIDEADFDKYLQEQKDRSKGDRAKNDATSAKNNEVWSSVAEQLKSKYGADFATEKLYYQGAAECDAKILAIVKDGVRADALQEGEQGFLVLDKTCFYPCGGGEVGDKGVIGSSIVVDTQKFKDDVIGHSVKAREELRVGDNVKCLSFRKRVGNNHTATHLLQSALRLALGDGVQQKGSQVDENGLRFDFSNTRAMTAEEIKKVEEIVNGWIADYLPVSAVEMPKSEAEKLNALHFFEDKYGEKVRVVRVFDRSGSAISTEFCGGIHCRNTGEIEAFAIESEKGIGSGVRRITALTGENACAVLANFRDMKSSFEMMKEEMMKYKSASSVADRMEKVFKMRDTAQFINGIIYLQGKDISQEVLKIVARSVMVKENKPVFITSDNKDEQFCYIVCQKNQEVNGKVLNCKDFMQKIIDKTNGKGGGVQNFAQVVHGVKGVDYVELLRNI